MSSVVRKQRLLYKEDWEPKEEQDDVFYVYILNFDNGSYYIGHSRELKGRIVEIRNDNNISDFGKEPKLQYFEIYPNRQAAMMREAEIKKIYKNRPREISRMISRFSELVQELDFEQ